MCKDPKAGRFVLFFAELMEVPLNGPGRARESQGEPSRASSIKLEAHFNISVTVFDQVSRNLK